MILDNPVLGNFFCQHICCHVDKTKANSLYYKELALEVGGIEPPSR